MTNTHDAITNGIAQELGATWTPRENPNPNQNWYRLEWKITSRQGLTWKETIVLKDGKLYIGQEINQYPSPNYIDLNNPNLVELAKTKMNKTRTKYKWPILD